MRGPRPRSIVIALVVVAAAGACLSVAAPPQFFWPRPARVARANADVPKILGNFVRIPGTPFLMADIRSMPEGRQSSLASYSDGPGPTTNNYVFLDLTDQSVRRLIPTNDHLIRGTEQFSDAGIVSPRFTTEGAAHAGVRWLVFGVVKLDSDRNGRLDENDLQTLAVSDAGGRGYTELIGEVTKSYGRALRDPDTLVVVYESGGTKRVSVIDLPKRAVTSTVALPSLGADVR